MPEHSNDALDDRWRDLADADAVGDELDHDERTFLREHGGDTPQRRAEMQLLGALADLDAPVPVTREDEAIADAVLAQFRDEASVTSGPRGELVAFPRRAIVAVGVLVTGLAAAAAVSLWMGPTPEAAPVIVAQTDASPAQRTGPILRSGALAVADTTLTSGDVVPSEVWLTGVRDGSCIESSICADEGAQLKLEGDEIDLRAGRIRVDGHFGPLHVTTFKGSVASEGGRFTVEVTQQRVVVVVLVGPVTVTDEDGERELASGSQHVFGDPLALEDPPDSEPTLPETPAAKPAPSNAAQMLATGQSLRGAGQHRRAASAYEQLLAKYPDSPEAHAAAVTLGKLQLDLGKARAALGAFDRYLSKGGALAEEAAYGRVRALDELGRAEQRNAAIDQFSAKYPRSVYVSKVEALRK